MNLTQIIQAARLRVDDDEGMANFFSADVYTRWANNAVVEACVRASLYRDDDTPSICDFTLVDNGRTIVLDDSIVVVKRAFIIDGIRQRPLELVTFGQADNFDPRWHHLDHKGEPITAIMDLRSKTMRFHPIPEKNYNLNLLVQRLPIASEKLSAGSDVPVILPEYMHKDLVSWMAYEFFSQHDTDGYEPDQALVELATFETRFGIRPDAKELVSQGRDRTRHAVAHFL